MTIKIEMVRFHMTMTFPPIPNSLSLLLLSTLSGLLCDGFMNVESFSTCHFKNKILKLSHDTFGSSFEAKSNIKRVSSFSKLRSHNNDNLYVYDNILSSDSCDLMHELAIDHSYRATNSDGSSIFRLDNPITPLEHCLCSILSEIESPKNDKNSSNDCYVEYWSRQEYLNLDTHADIDEEDFVEQSLLRCPNFAHVLYLQVCQDVSCPTIVFPTKLMGWNSDSVENNHGDDDMIEMATIPAVQGRLLRFDGRAMHAVPKPADRWLMNEKDEIALQKQEDDEHYSIDDDDGDYDDDEILRSVILFNTWSMPPRGVDADPDTAILPSGISFADDEEEVDEQELLRQKISNWELDYGPEFSDILCQSKSQWRMQHFMDESSMLKEDHVKNDDEYNNVRIKLMGIASRRKYKRKVVEVISTQSKSDIETALYQQSIPSKIKLKESSD